MCLPISVFRILLIIASFRMTQGTTNSPDDGDLQSVAAWDGEFKNPLLLTSCQTPLHLATKFQQLASVQVLLKHDINVNIPDLFGQTALHSAVFVGNKNIADILIASGAFIDATLPCTHWAPLHLASSLGHFEIVKLLLEHDVTKDLQDNNGMAALHLAAKYNASEIVKLLVESAADKEVRDAKGWRPLHFASISFSSDIIEILLGSDVDINARTNQGETPLYLASEAGRSDTTIRLLTAGANSFILNRNGMAALHISISKGRYETARLLLNYTRDNSYSKIDINICGPLGMTPLHFASLAEDGTILIILIQNGANLEARNSEGCTPLHLAVRNKNHHAAYLVSKANADLNTRDLSDRSPLHYAAETNDWRTLLMLLVAGANPNIRNAEDETPLFIAAKSDIIETLVFLLTAGASCTESDRSGRNPLHVAAAQGSHQTLTTLLFWCPNIQNTQDLDGLTPLHLAAIRGDSQIVALLLLWDADPNIVSKSGHSVLDMTAETDESTQQFLIAHHARGSYLNDTRILKIQREVEGLNFDVDRSEFYNQVYQSQFWSSKLQLWRQYYHYYIVPCLSAALDCYLQLCWVCRILSFAFLMTIISKRNWLSKLLLFILFVCLGIILFSIVGIYWDIPIPAGTWESLPLNITCHSPRLPHGSTISRPSWSYVHHHGIVWKDHTLCRQSIYAPLAICAFILQHPDRCIFHTGDGGIRGYLPNSPIEYLFRAFKFVEASQVNFASVDEFLRNKTSLEIGKITPSPDLLRISKLWDSQPEYRLFSNNCQHFVSLVASGLPVAADLLQIPALYSGTLLFAWLIYIAIWWLYPLNRFTLLRFIFVICLQVLVIICCCAFGGSVSLPKLSLGLVESALDGNVIIIFLGIFFVIFLLVAFRWILWHYPKKLLPSIVLLSWNFHLCIPMCCWAIIELAYDEIGTTIFGFFTIFCLLFYGNWHMYYSLVLDGQHAAVEEYFPAAYDG